MNSLGYGAGLSEESILGYIAWYTITKPRLTHNDIAKVVTDNGLDKSVIPSPPRAGDAFKRACRYSERKGIPIPYSPNTANFLIRSVTQTTEDIERHVVLEEVDPQGRRLSHTTVAELRFDRKTEVLHVKVRPPGTDLQPLVEEVLDRFAAALKDATKYVDAQVIRLMIRKQLEHMNAVLARSKGSVYFIPKKYRKQMDGLVILTEMCGVGSVFHAIPLVDDQNQQALVKGAFEEGIHEQAGQLVAELATARSSGKKLSAKVWNSYKNRLGSLVEKANEYSGIVDFQLTQSEVELDAVKAQLEDLLVEGLVA